MTNPIECTASLVINGSIIQGYNKAEEASLPGVPVIEFGIRNKTIFCLMSTAFPSDFQLARGQSIAYLEALKAADKAVLLTDMNTPPILPPAKQPQVSVTDEGNGFCTVTATASAPEWKNGEPSEVIKISNWFPSYAGVKNNKDNWRVCESRLLPSDFHSAKSYILATLLAFEKTQEIQHQEWKGEKRQGHPTTPVWVDKTTNGSTETSTMDLDTIRLGIYKQSEGGMHGWRLSSVPLFESIPLASENLVDAKAEALALFSNKVATLKQLADLASN